MFTGDDLKARLKEREELERDPSFTGQPDFLRAHEYSIYHREQVLRSETCGCFYCRRIFSPDTIREWTDDVEGEGQTALCPKCGIDSVLGSAAGFPITRDFLSRMKQHWF